ncbi:MAG TPA: hypothetical protein VM513_32490 [Kofleriaceae bacterium]|jgi:hypothetical protein|nr:hypothetical protein [Kofleriaceae bacterium]
MQKQSILIAWLALVPGCSDDSPVDEDLPGTIPLDLGTGEDSFWIDTDGVEPELAGCHIEFSESNCDFVAVSARNFGEFCQEDGTLVESNPGADQCHTHEDDIGHPYVVDCSAWCTDTLTLPNGVQRGVASATGRCEVVADVPCNEGVVDSARCVCE